MSATIGTPPPTRAINLNNGVLAASAPFFTGAQTWNNAAVAFTAHVFDITDTASAAGSSFVDYKVGGVSRFKVRKDGRPTVSVPGSGETASFGFEHNGSCYFELSANANIGYLRIGAVGGSGQGVELFSDNNLGLRVGHHGGSTRLSIGGQTSAFPALKRSGTQLQARLADDSGFTELRANIRLETDAPPAAATDTGTTGQIRYDADYIYLCVATDTWVRSPLSTW